ncbi:MAG: hypothetical protein QOE70_1770 [Chthoniobacter sp.]|jgi:hypothetical protein|nr:hypothetical protein [Chthoniobacter sp.]
MNHCIFRIILAACIAFAAFASQSTVRAEQPHMEKAIDLLQKAKTDSTPIPMLQKAKEQIKDARHNKGGRRGDAIEAINEAIEVSKKGGNPESKINQAIAMIHSGTDRAH